jgi:hypothetical protein
LEKPHVLFRKTTRGFLKNYTWFFSIGAYFSPVRCPFGEVRLCGFFGESCEDIFQTMHYGVNALNGNQVFYYYICETYDMEMKEQ